MPGRQQSTGTWSNKAVQHECEQINLKGHKCNESDVLKKKKEKMCSTSLTHDVWCNPRLLKVINCTEGKKYHKFSMIPQCHSTLSAALQFNICSAIVLRHGVQQGLGV